MKPIYLDGDNASPKIQLDKEKGIFEISGRSILENAAKFYDPIIEWLGEYVNNPNDETNFILNIEYLNSSSSKKIVNLIVELEKIIDVGKNIKVTWYYDVNDEVMLEKGEEISAIIEVPFEFLEYDYEEDDDEVF